MFKENNDFNNGKRGHGVKTRCNVRLGNVKQVYTERGEDDGTLLLLLVLRSLAHIKTLLPPP